MCDFNYFSFLFGNSCVIVTKLSVTLYTRLYFAWKKCFSRALECFPHQLAENECQNSQFVVLCRDWPWASCLAWSWLATQSWFVLHCIFLTFAFLQTTPTHVLYIQMELCIGTLKDWLLERIERGKRWYCLFI